MKWFGEIPRGVAVGSTKHRKGGETMVDGKRAAAVKFVVDVSMGHSMNEERR